MWSIQVRTCTFTALLLLGLCAAATAQSVTVSRNVNLRPEQSTEYPAIRLLKPDEPPLELLESHSMDGYYHVKTQAGEEGYVWSRAVHVSVEEPAGPAALAPRTVGRIELGPGVPGSASMRGCGDGLWKHAYHPTQLMVRNDCVTVTGVIVDATAHQSRHTKDGARHEGDGDTHSWLKVDAQFSNLVNDGTTSDEEGNLVFELVCHYTVRQEDAKDACKNFTDKTKIPPIGSHVAVRGTLITEKNHGKWNEIHPVSSIKVQH